MNDREPVSRSVAVERLLDCRAELLAAAASEPIGIDAIPGRTLAEGVHAPRDVPPHDYATMDGYAVPAGEGASPADDGSFAVVGSVAPEDDLPEIEPGEAVRVATGAPLPARTDAVVKRENAVVENGRLADPSLPPGTNVDRRGTTARAGERLFAAGDRLAPRHAALLCDVGIETAPVHERRSVAVVATGTEIHEGRQPDRDSDFLVGLLRRWGHEPANPETVPDDPAAVRETVERAAATHDAVLTTGGTSVGSSDHVSTVLADHDPLFAGVRFRPGRPVTAAVMDGSPVIALPGKPLAAHTAAVLVARALFVGKEALPTVTVESARRVGIADDDLEYAVPVVLDDARGDGDRSDSDRADGRTDDDRSHSGATDHERAMPLGHVDSSLPIYEGRFAPGRVASSTRATLADGFVLAETSIEQDERVEMIPYPVVE